MNIQQPSNLESRSAWAARQRARRLGARAGGFTLIELMVVLAIMAIVTSITVGAFRSLSDNNQRTGCQANLAQVYQGLRLYMADENSQPPLYNPNAKDPEKKGIGLWNLWTFPDPNDMDKIGAIGSVPTARYLRTTNLLHCPSDTDPSVDIRTNVDLFTDATKQAYNPDYLSYQMFATDGKDGKDNTYSATDEKKDIDAARLEAYTYLPSRAVTLASGASAADKEAYKRQLRQNTPGATNAGVADPLQRPALDSTVVTWCRHHRYARDYDNVLFFDGSVQIIPRQQDEFKPGTCDTTGNKLYGSNRVPRRPDCD